MRERTDVCPGMEPSLPPQSSSLSQSDSAGPCIKSLFLGLLWCPVVKNPSCNAGDMGLIPGQGTKIPHAEEQLKPVCHNY